MKNIIIPFLIFFSHSIIGQEYHTLLIDQNGNKLDKANLLILDENLQTVDIEHADTIGLISIAPMYFSPKYSFEVDLNICNTNTVKVLESINNNQDTIIAYFDDTCLILNKKVLRIYSLVREIEESKKTTYGFKYFKIDSIRINCTKKKDKVQIVSTFKSSGEKLKINLYYKNNDLIFCSIQEANRLKKQSFKVTEFYFENNEIIYEQWFYYGNIIGAYIIGEKHLPEPELGYCENFKIGFLRMVITEVVKRI